MSELLTILTLQGGYNTIVVMIGSAAFGVACGAIGVFTMLRRRALVSDAVAHATLPGVAAGFLLGSWLGYPSRSVALLTIGALLSAILAAAAIQALSRRPRITPDTATAAVLAATFGLGVALLSIVQTLRTGGQAGLDAYLLGSTAGMLLAEAQLICALGFVVVLSVAFCLKELSAVAFDPDFARTSGLPIARLDALVAALSLACVVSGLRIVGLVLAVALLVIPPAAARFWSHHIGVVVALSAAMGGASAYLGAAASAAIPDLPTGAVIVLIAAAFFTISFLFGSARGVVMRTHGSRKALACRPSSLESSA
ncbi:metal ABC transporter permease [Microvirga massiliensis]|uniref:metal ABC transporter permease n=1 Tax=Microvirga massiliensis TaxID=1033741 RepID=UPI00062BCE05|nr:metal ABC transporter permease [Microvirga massiliensis]